MHIIEESRVPKDLGYFHLAYIAASAPVPAPQKGLLAAGIFLIGSGILLLRAGGTLATLAHVAPGFIGFLSTAAVLVLFAVSFTGQLIGAPVTVVMMIVVAQFALGYLAIRSLRDFYQHPGKGSAATAPGKTLGGKGLVMVGLCLATCAFAFGRPQYQHPDWMTHSNMRVIAREVDKEFAKLVPAEKRNGYDLDSLPPGLGNKLIEALALLDTGLLDDGWHRPMKAGPSGTKDGFFDLVSAGSDGVLSTPDDITGTVKLGHYGTLDVEIASAK